LPNGYSTCSISYPEISMGRIDRHILRLHTSNVPGKTVLDLGDAAIDVLRRSLNEHLNGAVRKISYKPSQPVPDGDAVSGEAKAHSLYSSAEDHVLADNHLLPISTKTAGNSSYATRNHQITQAGIRATKGPPIEARV